MIWFRIGMLAPFLSLAFFAAEVSGAIALPQEMELPLPSEVETGTNSPITPASSRTAPTAMINRRSVTIRPFVRGLRLKGDNRCIAGLNRSAVGSLTQPFSAMSVSTANIVRVGTPVAPLGVYPHGPPVL